MTDILKCIFFLPPTQNCLLFLSSFLSSRPSAGCWQAAIAPTSYIVFVVVDLYLGLLENICTCEFHRHWRFLFVARCHFIVYNSDLYICSIIDLFGYTHGYRCGYTALFSDSCCHILVTSSYHCCLCIQHVVPI